MTVNLLPRPVRDITSIIVGLLAVTFADDATAVPTTIIVSDGGSVVSAVATANNGDIIEIRSNQTFIGTLDWRDKFLTIQASAGFSPTIKGSVGSDAISRASGDDNAGAGGAIRGVTLQSGGNRAVTLSGVGDSETNISFDHVIFDGGVAVVGTGNYHTNTRFSDCTFLDEFAIGNAGEAFHDLLFERNRIAGVFRAHGNSTGGFNILAVDNLHAKTAISPFSSGVIIAGDSFNQSKPNARFVNSTVVGWDIGLVVAFNAKASFENMLLDNVDDIGRFDSMAMITNSLVSDGTFAGMNGNIGGTPLLDANFSLLPGSPGIDAGNNAAANLPLTDIRGMPRIRDGNSDGLARVDVGAYEVVPEPNALALVLISVITMAYFRCNPSATSAAYGALEYAPRA